MQPYQSFSGDDNRPTYEEQLAILTLDPRGHGFWYRFGEKENSGYIPPGSLLTAIRSVLDAFHGVMAPDVFPCDFDTHRQLDHLPDLLGELKAHGSTPVVNSSGSEGHRHVFALVQDPRLLAHFKNFADKIDRTLFRTDIRPPLGRHPLNLPVELIEPRDPADAIAALMRDGETVETRRALFERPPRLSPRIHHLLKYGDPDKRRYSYEGAVHAAIITDSVRVGLTKAVTFEKLLNPKNAGGAHLQSLRGSAAKMEFERCYREARTLIARNPDWDSRAVRNRIDAIEAAAAARKFPSPERRALFANFVKVVRVRNDPDDFQYSLREMADDTGITLNAAWKGVGWFERAGLVARTYRPKLSERGKASRWRLVAPKTDPRDQRQEQKDKNPIPDPPAAPPAHGHTRTVVSVGEEQIIDCSRVTLPAADHDLWRGWKGKYQVCSVLARAGGATARQIADALHSDASNVRRHLNGEDSLEYFGLVVRVAESPRRWIVSPADFELVAKIRGKQGAGARQRQRHRQDRARYQDRQDAPAYDEATAAVRA